MKHWTEMGLLRHKIRILMYVLSFWKDSKKFFTRTKMYLLHFLRIRSKGYTSTLKRQTST